MQNNFLGKFQFTPCGFALSQFNPQSFMDEWMTPIVHYLRKGWLPKDKIEARKIQIRVACLVIIDDVLYRRGYSLPYLRCVSSKEVDYVLCEIHEGIFGNHAGARSLAGKALRAGYYWPTLQKYAYDIIRSMR